MVNTHPIPFTLSSFSFLSAECRCSIIGCILTFFWLGSYELLSTKCRNFNRRWNLFNYYFSEEESINCLPLWKVVFLLFQNSLKNKILDQSLYFFFFFVISVQLWALINLFFFLGYAALNYWGFTFACSAIVECKQFFQARGVGIESGMWHVMVNCWKDAVMEKGGKNSNCHNGASDK